MTTEPIVTIGAVMTSIKLAVIAVLTLIASQMDMNATDAGLLIAAGSAITVAVGDLLTYYLSRQRVTPIAAPNGIAPGTVINASSPEPSVTVPQA